MEYSIKNILSNQKPNNECYTNNETVKEFIEHFKIPKDKVIWCPFDKEDSAFVQVLKQENYKVIHSHIDNKQDFYTYEPQEHWDIIVSNPPFSKKRLLIEHCEKFKKPFYLLYGTTIFSQSMGNTLNRLNFWFIHKPVKFNCLNGEIKKFLCCWVYKEN